MKTEHGNAIEMVRKERETAKAMAEKYRAESAKWQEGFNELHKITEALKQRQLEELEALKKEYQEKYTKLNELNTLNAMRLDAETKKGEKNSEEAKAREKILVDERNTLQLAYDNVLTRYQEFKVEFQKQVETIDLYKKDQASHVMNEQIYIDNLAMKQKELDLRIAEANQLLKEKKFALERIAEMQKEAAEARDKVFVWQGYSEAVKQDA